MGTVALSDKERGSLSLPLVSPPRSRFFPSPCVFFGNGELPVISFLRRCLSLSFPLPSRVSSPPPVFLSISKPLSFLNASPRPSTIRASSGLSLNTRLWRWTRRHRSNCSQFCSPWNIVLELVEAHDGPQRRRCSNADLQPLLTAALGSKQFHLNILVAMVPSICNESAQIVGTFFRAKWQNFDSWSKPNRALFWGNDLESILVAKYDFQQYIISPCLESFTISHNEKNCGKCQFNSTSFCLQDQPWLGIKNRDHSRTRFDATNLMVVSNLVNKLMLKIMFLEACPIV